MVYRRQTPPRVQTCVGAAQHFHESSIGPNYGANFAQVRVSLIEGRPISQHEVEQNDRRGPRYPRMAVNEHPLAAANAIEDEPARGVRLGCKVVFWIVWRPERRVANAGKVRPSRTIAIA
jgi:hypothetical protein